jgi:hypothetical protein
MVAESPLITASEYAALPKQNALIELIDGELVVPPPLTSEHQATLVNPRDFLNEIARVRGFGRRYFAPVAE